MRRAAVFSLLLAVALPACDVIQPEGRQQTTTFTTFLTRQEVRTRAESWLTERGLYGVTRSEPTFVRGEKRRPRSVGPGEQIDVLSVSMETVAEGTRVEVQAQTFLPVGSGGREQADQLSPEAGTDHASLVQVLMPRPF
jgi:hypothetical protein